MLTPKLSRLVGKSCIFIAMCITIFACSKKEHTNLKTQPYDFEKFAIATIAPDDDIAISLLEMAKKHVTPSDNNAVFDEVFTRHYDAEFTLYNDLNYMTASDINDLPPTVFLSIMLGSKRLHQFDWKSIYSAEDIIYILNEAFTLKQLPILSKQEAQLFNIPNVRELPGSEGVILMKEMMAQIVEQRNSDILWLNGGGDYYEFFVINKGSAQKLHKKRLSSYLMFCATSSDSDDCE